MLFDHSYLTIESESIAEFQAGGSRFIAHALPVSGELEVRTTLQKFRAGFPKANHHCHAAVLGSSRTIKLHSDDREPSNSAGRPILRAIEAQRLTFVMVVVVRYFGGKLLGVSGLIEAYGTASTAALNKAVIVEKEITETYALSVNGAFAHEAFRIMKQFKLPYRQEEQDGKFILIFEVNRARADQVLASLSLNHRFKIHYDATKITL